jgi:uncharacterized protein
MNTNPYYLPEGLPRPTAENDGLSKPYWDALRDEQLLIQRCAGCQTWQWGPEWICHHCLSFNMTWQAVAPRGRIYSWERSHHPVHPALKERGPYIAILVEMPRAGQVRMLGNLLGEASQDVIIGAEVIGEYEHHGGHTPYTLLQWRYAS